MRKIFVKQGSPLQGNYYTPEQISGLSRFIKAAKYRGHSFADVRDAWTEAYGQKCERKRVHMKVRYAVFSTSVAPDRLNKGYSIQNNLSLGERLKLAMSNMDAHDIKLSYCAYMEVAMRVFNLTPDDFVARKEEA